MYRNSNFVRVHEVRSSMSSPLVNKGNICLDYMIYFERIRASEDYIITMLTLTNISFCDSAQVMKSMALSSVVLSISSVGGLGCVLLRSCEATWLKT